MLKFPKLNESDREALRAWVWKKYQRAQGMLAWATEDGDKANEQYHLGHVHALVDVVWELDEMARSNVPPLTIEDLFATRRAMEQTRPKV